MTVLDVVTSTEALTLTLTARFHTGVEQVWQLWQDPRLLERWWGPPTYPATVVEQDFTPEGRLTYYMTSPEGERYHGWWRIIAIHQPHSLEFEDGFANPDGTPNSELPVTRANVSIAAESNTQTGMTIVTTFASLEAMEQLVTMGMVEGLSAAVGQMDALLDATV